MSITSERITVTAAATTVTTDTAAAAAYTIWTQRFKSHELKFRRGD